MRGVAIVGGLTWILAFSAPAYAQVACAGSGKWRECNHGIWQAQQQAAKKAVARTSRQSSPPRSSLLQGRPLIGADGATLNRR